MKSFGYILLAFLSLGFPPVSFGEVPLPKMNTGDWYDADEEIKLTSPQLGSGGFATLMAQARYLVRGIETVRQEKTGSYYWCYHLEGTGTTEGVGEFNVTDPLPFQGLVKIDNGSFNADIWVGVNDFATVKKSRVMSGTVSYAWLGQWVPVGQILFNENEEYDPPLRDTIFPMDINAV